MDKYTERKLQLYRAMKKALEGSDGSICLVADDQSEQKVFYPISYGEKRREVLREIFLDEYEEDDPLIFVSTGFVNDSGEEGTDCCGFTEFSNEEMEEIMRLAGVPIPEKSEQL